MVDPTRLPQNLLPDTDQHVEMLRKACQEVVDGIAQQRKETEAGSGAGLILLVLPAAQFPAVRLDYVRKPDNS